MIKGLYMYKILVLAVTTLTSVSPVLGMCQGKNREQLIELSKRTKNISQALSTIADKFEGEAQLHMLKFIIFQKPVHVYSAHFCYMLGTFIQESKKLSDDDAQTIDAAIQNFKE